MFDDLLDLFDRRNRRSGSDRKGGLRGMLDSLTGDHDDRSSRDRSDRDRHYDDDDDHDDDRDDHDDGRYDRRRGNRSSTARRERDPFDFD